MKYLKRTLLILAAFIAALILTGEFIGRVLMKERFKYSPPYKTNMYQPDSVVNYTGIPNYDYVYYRDGKTYHINNLGFLGPDFPEKTNDKFRIAMVGDSFTAGVIYFSPFTTFSHEMQLLFDQHNYSVEVLNCSTDGANRSYDIFKSVEYQVIKSKPDMILLDVGIPLRTENIVREAYNGYRMSYPLGNDSLRTMLMHTVDKAVRYKAVHDFFYKFYIVKIFFRMLHRYDKHLEWNVINQLLLTRQITVFGEDRNIIKFSVEESVKMIRELRDRLKQNGIELFLYTIPDSPGMIQIAKSHELPLISLKVNLEEEERFPKDAHPNVIGNQRIARRFYEIIDNHDLVPEQYRPDRSGSN